MQVEQIDREAAVEYWNGLADEWNSWTEISGQEQDATVQAFARHRHQARAEHQNIFHETISKAHFSAVLARDSHPGSAASPTSPWGREGR